MMTKSCKAQTLITRALLILLMVVFLTSCTGFDPQAYVPGLETSAPLSTSTPERSLPISPSVSPTGTVPASGKAVVCTNIPNGKLHVRFDPGDQSEVRGYLTDGESVILSGEQKELEKGLWVKLSRPVEGWVNATYLCKAEQ
jgi:hypothetical protein